MLRMTDRRLAAMQEEQARRHLDEGRSIQREMRGFKHDLRHHLQTIKGQLGGGADRPGNGLP